MHPHIVWLLATAAVLVRASVAPLQPRGVEWTYRGCFTDRLGDRTLRKSYYGSSSSMTIDNCLVFCTRGGFSFAGLEYGGECFCDYAIGTSSVLDSDKTCNSACTGKSTEKCGGRYRIAIWGNGQSPPFTNRGPPGGKLLSCYDDSVNKRILSTQIDVPGGSDEMTVASCVNSCKAQGFSYAGVEYAGECFCDKSWTDRDPSWDRYCNLPCKGNKTEYCGGDGAIGVYDLTGTTHRVV